MVKEIKHFVLFFMISFSIFSCSIFEKGFTDGNDQYVPKRPNFKLKDKPDNQIPHNLDLTHLYRIDRIIYNGTLDYPSTDGNPEINSVAMYTKFYENGRCLSFSIPLKDDLGNPRSLTENDLNPNLPNYSKDYYYCKDSKTIEVETFVYGTGTGVYVRSSCTLSADGQTLTFDDHHGSVTIYIKEEIPSEWGSFPIDW